LAGRRYTLAWFELAGELRHDSFCSTVKMRILFELKSSTMPEEFVAACCWLFSYLDGYANSRLPLFKPFA
jgi:hypothetical protein